MRHAYGGMQNIGTAGQIQSLNHEEKPTYNANMTWVRGKHTYKFGAEVYLEQGYTGPSRRPFRGSVRDRYRDRPRNPSPRQ